jgi:hypothetical protein
VSFAYNVAIIASDGGSPLDKNITIFGKDS